MLLIYWFFYLYINIILWWFILWRSIDDIYSILNKNKLLFHYYNIKKEQKGKTSLILDPFWSSLSLCSDDNSRLPTAVRSGGRDWYGNAFSIRGSNHMQGCIRTRQTKTTQGGAWYWKEENECFRGCRHIEIDMRMLPYAGKSRGRLKVRSHDNGKNWIRRAKKKRGGTAESESGARPPTGMRDEGEK